MNTSTLLISQFFQEKDWTHDIFFSLLLNKIKAVEQYTKKEEYHFEQEKNYYRAYLFLLTKEAILDGRHDVIDALIQEGLEIHLNFSLPSELPHTIQPLVYYAISVNNVKALDQLVKAGAKLFFEDEFGKIPKRGSSGQRYVFYPNTNTISHVFPISECHQNALAMAVDFYEEYYDDSTIHYLLKQYEYGKLFSWCEHRNLVLHNVVNNGNIALLEKLHQFGLNTKIDDFTPVFKACDDNRLDFIDYFVEKGLDSYQAFQIFSYCAVRKYYSLISYFITTELCPGMISQIFKRKNVSFDMKDFIKKEMNKFYLHRSLENELGENSLAKKTKI